MKDINNIGGENLMTEDVMKLKDYDPSSNIMPTLTKLQFDYISTDLINRHEIFYTLWNIALRNGGIKFSKSTPTAAVVFENKKDVSLNDSQKVIAFYFNPDYWNKVNYNTKLFIICHEALHIIFRHGFRIRNSKMPQFTNIATEVIVNHTLVNRFDFNRDEVTNASDLCWTDTIFPGKKIRDDSCFEVYLREIIKDKNIQYHLISQNKNSMDSHDGLGGSGGLGDSTTQQEQDEFLKALDDMLPDEAKSSVEDILKNNTEGNPDYGKKDSINNSVSTEGRQQADNDNKSGKDCSTASPGRKVGSEKGNKFWTFPKKSLKTVRTWKSLAKEFYKRWKHAFEDDEQWARINRRMSNLSSDFFLPSLMEEEDVFGKSKIDAFVFLDVSGSCESFVPRFRDAVRTIPKKYFHLNLFSFDTQTHPIINGKILGGGGTAFNIIEERIQHEMVVNKRKYPQIVIIITDGEGNEVSPAYPDRWYWLMPKSSRCESYCNSKSKIYDLEHFE
jgi:hypothetical protein